MTASDLAQDHVATAPRASAIRTLRLERAGIAALETALAVRGPEGLGGAFDAAVVCMSAAAGRTIVTGMGKSGHIGRKVAATMASTGTPAYFVHPGEASHGDLGMIRQDVCLCLPKAEEACPNGLAPTTSTTMQLAVGDALAVALLEVRGFSASDFRLFHPGGKLGASLTCVRDVMHAGDRLPLIRPDATMGEAILEISAKGFGCVGVIDPAGKLIGIVTDGDLRRHMAPNLVTARVGDIMTTRPRTIVADLLAAVAMEILNSKKITALFVLDGEGLPGGIVHLHDLLRVGVA